MEPQIRKYLRDALWAIELIGEFSRGRELDDFVADALLRTAVERQFLIIGEVFIRVERLDPDLVARVPEYRRIIGFRNVLAHDYGTVDAGIVWDAVESRLPLLREAIEGLLDADSHVAGDSP